MKNSYAPLVIAVLILLLGLVVLAAVIPAHSVSALDPTSTPRPPTRTPTPVFTRVPTQTGTRAPTFTPNWTATPSRTPTAYYPPNLVCDP